MSDIELLPCPFCSGTDAMIERPGTNRQSMIIVCQDCGARVESGDVVGQTRVEAWKWNQRQYSGTKMWVLYHGGESGEYSECSIFDVEGRELFDDEDIAKKREADLNEANAGNREFFTHLFPLVVGKLRNDEEEEED